MVNPDLQNVHSNCKKSYNVFYPSPKQFFICLDFLSKDFDDVVNFEPNLCANFEVFYLLKILSFQIICIVIFVHVGQCFILFITGFGCCAF